MLQKNIDLNGKTVLVTGAAGFIGSFLVKSLLKKFNVNIVGVDNLNSYYDVNLKYARLKEAEDISERIRLSSGGKSRGGFTFLKTDISDKTALFKVFEDFSPDVVVNLAAQAGVRYSIENPDAYISSNIIGFFNILEACRHYPVLHLVYASSSSVYGGNKKVPFSTDDKVDNPVSLYAATKKSDELISYSYSRLYGIPSTGLRFFTVYGPAGRPDMAYFSFANKLSKGDPIRIFNYGNCKRDFTYIDDIVYGIELVMQRAPLANEKEVERSESSDEAACAGRTGRIERAESGESVRNAGDAGTQEKEKEAGNANQSVNYKAVNYKKANINEKTGNTAVPYMIYNIGGGQPENLMDFVNILSEELIRAGVLARDFNIRDHMELVPMQAGDVEVTFADSSALERDFGFVPRIKLREGLRSFAEWYAGYRALS